MNSRFARVAWSTPLAVAALLSSCSHSLLRSPASAPPKDAAGMQLSSSAARAEVGAQLKDVAPNLTGIAKDAKGNVLRMNQSDADNYCRNQGQRLPTARELALHSQSLGAQGISETEKYGYYLRQVSDSAGNPDRFYFSHDGYKRPAGELGDNWFWSSSVLPDDSDLAYRLSGFDGGIYTTYIYAFRNGAVLCVQSR